MRRSLFLALFAAALLLPTPALAANTVDFPIPDGHWYTQTNGADFPTQIGYSVRDTATIKLWSEFQRLGGLPVLGYPVSQRYLLDGFVVQAFQKAILQWHPETGHVQFLNIFDRLHDAGKDDYLLHFRQTPPPGSTAADAGKPWAQVVAAHQTLLDANPAIKAAYFADPDPIDHYGLPMTGPVDEGNAIVVRAQRAVFQQWKQAVPWAAAGQVTVANGGDIAKEAGLVPLYAVPPAGADFQWPAVQGGPLRVDAWDVALDLAQLPPGYIDNTPLAYGAGANGVMAAQPSPSYIQHDNGPFASFVDPGLVNRDVRSFVQDRAAASATGAIIIDNETSLYDSAQDAQADYDRRVQHLRCCHQPVSVGPLGDGAVGATAPGSLSTGARFTTYGILFHQANLAAYVGVTYTGQPGSYDQAVQLAKAELANLALPAP